MKCVVLNEPGAFSIEERPAKYVRCDDWCPVSKWCSQLKAERLLNAMEGNGK